MFDQWRSDPDDKTIECVERLDTRRRKVSSGNIYPVFNTIPALPNAFLASLAILESAGQAASCRYFPVRRISFLRSCLRYESPGLELRHPTWLRTSIGFASKKLPRPLSSIEKSPFASPGNPPRLRFAFPPSSEPNPPKYDPAPGSIGFVFAICPQLTLAHCRKIAFCVTRPSRHAPPRLFDRLRAKAPPGISAKGAPAGQGRD
jgi:hypothetical protein